MGRPPCREKTGTIKKGPWRPEEDIILVSYIQEHGPGNWRSVPINTCLRRCSKSCRLRWTNYLRPGIRRGNFTPHEQDIIVQLQSLLGNKWATIASYLPQRTDSEIKNYWNNSLKKKLNKQHAIGAISAPPHHAESCTIPTAASHVNDHHDITTTNPLYMDSYARPASSNLADEVTQLIAPCSPIATINCCYRSSSFSYAFSMDNISILLNGFMKSCPTQADTTDASVNDNNPLFPLDHMSNCAPLPTSDVPPLIPPPLPHQQELSSVEDWLATNQVVDQLMEISDGGCLFPMLF